MMMLHEGMKLCVRVCADAHACVCVVSTTLVTDLVFSLQVYILKKEEGGRHTPFVNNYAPQLFTRTADVTVHMMVRGFVYCLLWCVLHSVHLPPPLPLPPQLPEGKEMVMPGDDTDLTLTLINDIPLEEGQRFTLREGSKTVGTGVVTRILE